jgi:hypothetical protein
VFGPWGWHGALDCGWAPPVHEYSAVLAAGQSSPVVTVEHEPGPDPLEQPMDRTAASAATAPT